MDVALYATLPLVCRVLVAIGWVGFFAFFVLWRKPREKGVKSAPASKLGIALQAVAFAVVWIIQRPLPRAGLPLGAGEILLDVLAPIVSFLSIGMGIWALRTLGAQWSYTARLVEGHQLVTSGPYRIVRHPIYSAMLGKLLATNFAFGHWIGLLLAGTLYFIGTMVRVRSEEKLLRQAFGQDFVEYARRVPAFVPFRI